MNPKTLIIYPYSSRHLGLFADLASRDDVVLHETEKKPVGIVASFFRWIHLSRKLNRFFLLPFKEIWYRLPPVDRYKDSLERVIIIDGALNCLTEPYLRKLKKDYPKIHFYVYLINSFGAASREMEMIKQYILSFPWDGIFTFDPQEAITYNMKYLGFCYYSKHSIETDSEKKPETYDAYFVGGLKGGRDGEILSVFDYLSDHGLKCHFNLLLYGKTIQKKREGLTLRAGGWLPYEQVLREINQCNCIVEILQHGQSGPSLRYFEAVCYNKRLLSNNPHIVDFPYYNPEFMRIFHSPEEIDIDWVKGTSEIPVDYHYQGDFSPNTMIDYFMNQT